MAQELGVGPAVHRQRGIDAVARDGRVLGLGQPVPDQ
jgi:hypothetical protein